MSSLEISLYAVGSLTLACGLLAMGVRNLVHALLWFGLSLMGTAVLFAQLGASFLAGMQILLYVGGVVMLLIFGVMLTREHEHLGAVREVNHRIRAAVVSLVLFAALVMAILHTPGLDQAPGLASQATAGVTLDQLAVALLGPYGIAFEVLSLLLLATMVGAIVLARKRDPGEPTGRKPIGRQNLGKQRIEGLASPIIALPAAAASVAAIATVQAPTVAVQAQAPQTTEPAVSEHESPAERPTDDTTDAPVDVAAAVALSAQGDQP